MLFCPRSEPSQSSAFCAPLLALDALRVRRSSLPTPAPPSAPAHTHARAPGGPARTAGRVQQLLLGCQPVAAAAHHKAHAPDRPTAGPFRLVASSPMVAWGRFGRRGPKRAQHASCTTHPMTPAQHCTPQLVAHGLPPHDACLLPPNPAATCVAAALCGAHHTHWRLAARAADALFATGSSNPRFPKWQVRRRRHWSGAAEL